MNNDLRTVLANLSSDRGPSLLLVFGDEFRVAEACRAIVDLLVPTRHRGLNLERFDGREAAWEQIEGALNTPPFLPGRKVVWVENAPYFSAGEQGAGLPEKVLQLWSEGNREQACSLLMDLLVAEGWTVEQWKQVRPADIAQALQTDGEECADLLLECQRRRAVFPTRRLFQDRRVLQLLDEPLPAWCFLLLTTPEVDRRTGLYKRLEEIGGTLYLGLDRDRSGRVTREELATFINQQLRQAGKNIEPQARELILFRTGEELRALKQELEKLIVYIGECSTVRRSDVDALFTDQSEGWVFDLTRSVSNRDSATALSHLTRLLAAGEHPLKLLATIANEVRRLLGARQLLEGELRGRWRGGMTYQQFQNVVLRNDTKLLSRNSFADYMCLQRADKFSGPELRRYLGEIYNADIRLKTTGHQPRRIMERLVVRMCLGAERATARVIVR